MKKRVLTVMFAVGLLITGCSSVESTNVEKAENTDTVKKYEEPKEESKEIIIGESTLQDCLDLWGASTNYIEESQETCFRDSKDTIVGVATGAMDKVKQLTFEVSESDSHINREGKDSVDRAASARIRFDRHINQDVREKGEPSYIENGIRIKYPDNSSIDVIYSGDFVTRVILYKYV